MQVWICLWLIDCAPLANDRAKVFPSSRPSALPHLCLQLSVPRIQCPLGCRDLICRWHSSPRASRSNLLQL